MPRSHAACLAVGLAAPLLCGCLERKERITVEPDGQVLIEASFESKSFAEIHEGDAIPALETGWAVVDSVHQDKDGEDVFRLEATAVFPPEIDLPGTYARAGDPEADAALQFPTELVIEDRPDGTYYHFHRRYAGRSWATLDTLRRHVVEEAVDEQGRKFEQLTPDEQARTIQAFVDFEAVKMLIFARKAFLEVSPEIAQDRWLAVDASVRDLAARFDPRKVVGLLAIENDEIREQAIADESQRWQRAADERLDAALREHCGYGGARLTAFRGRLRWHKRYHEISEDLGDETFEISLIMPGGIVGSNADATAINTATWSFRGEDLRDRDIEIMVSSRVVQ
jgi:hypothetical protein